MPQMTNLDIDFISLVNKGANKQSIKIYKSDKEASKDSQEEKEFRSFFDVIKSFFTKDKVEKEDKKPTDFNAIIGQVETEERIRQARWVLMDVLENILDDASIVDKATTMSTEIDKFKNYVVSTVNMVGVAKSLEQIKKIKNEECEDMNAEDIKKMLDEALKPINDDIRELKGEDIEEIEKKEDKTPKTEAEMIAEVIEKAIGPVREELEELKKSRKPSQAIVGNNGEEIEEPSYLAAFRKAFEE